MLDNQITLSVDVENNGTLVPTVFTRFDEYQNRTIYKGPNHTLTSRDTLGYYRTPVKNNGTDFGTAKSALKFTQDIQVPGKVAETLVVKPIIAEVSFSIPVGATPAQTLALRQRVIAACDHAIASRLVDELEI